MRQLFLPPNRIPHLGVAYGAFYAAKNISAQKGATSSSVSRESLNLPDGQSLVLASQVCPSHVEVSVLK